MLVQLAEAEASETALVIPPAAVCEPGTQAPSPARGIAYAVVLSVPFWALIAFTFYLIV